MSDRTYADCLFDLKDAGDMTGDDNSLYYEAAYYIKKLHYHVHELGEMWMKRVYDRSEN